jgi:hypothetical protein
MGSRKKKGIRKDERRSRFIVNGYHSHDLRQRRTTDLLDL